MDKSKDKIEQLKELIDSSNNIVFFGGAGVSTESGIPDFRSKNGLYNQSQSDFNGYDPEYLLSVDCLSLQPRIFYKYYRQNLNYQNIEPNKTHLKLAEMESKGKLSAIITQNIDGLHQKAGSKNVIEIHGSAQEAHCRYCGKKYSGNIMFKNTKDGIPRCDCGGAIRPDIVLYGECLPKKAWDDAHAAIAKADLVIVGGTSLSVFPANVIISMYYNRLVIINRSKTNMDEKATLIIHKKLGGVFSQL